jgi:catechol 2,3-dioxygenase-like lactoylglutathione lyase family enzyme
MIVSKLDHVGIAVSDWRASRDWYTNILGMKLEFEVPAGGAAGLGVAALQDDAGLTLFVEQLPAGVRPCGCTHTFQVDDVDALYAKLSAAGVSFLKAPQKQYWGYGAELADPDGHVIRLWDEKSMREKGGF